MNGKRIRKISIWLVTALYMLACVSPFIATPVASIQAPEMVGTVVVQTAFAAQTQTAILLPKSTLTPIPTPTLIPTKTPTPTPTLVPLITMPVNLTSTLTATPTVTFVLTQAGTDFSNSSNDGTSDGKEKSDYSSVIDKEWACTVLEKSPHNSTIIGSGVRFSAVWILLNRGIKTWPIHSVDFVFKAGLRNEGRARYDLPSAVISGGKIMLDVTITAPNEPGSYRSVWTLRVGRKKDFCGMTINFVVK